MRTVSPAPAALCLMFLSFAASAQQDLEPAVQTSPAATRSGTVPPGTVPPGSAPPVSPLTRQGASASWAFPLAFPPIRSGPSNAVGTRHSPTQSAVTGDGIPGTPNRSKTSQVLRRDRRHVDPGARALLACRRR